MALVKALNFLLAFLHRLSTSILRLSLWSTHCVKSVWMLSYFWSVFSCIRTECRKIRTRNNPVFGHPSGSDSHSKYISYLPLINLNVDVIFRDWSSPYYYKTIWTKTVSVSVLDFTSLIVSSLVYGVLMSA